MQQNLLLMTDSYKFTHWRQYPPGTERVYSYIESRGGMFAETVFFGLQYYLKRYLQGEVFTAEDIDEADEFCREHFGHEAYFNRQGWLRLYKSWGGRLPLEVKAVPEGTVVPVSNAVVTVENTDPSFPWLTNYLETLLLKIWYPITVATLSREIKKVFLGHLERTGDPSLISFKLHDFGYRGVSSEETAAVGAAAHLLNFQGTDTVAGIRLLQTYYGVKGMPGCSVPAAEHSTITAWGREHERDAYRNLLEEFPEGIVACVSDSYDVFDACEHIWGEQLRDMVLARDGVLVIRPDSGDPKRIVLSVLEMLGRKFGFAINSKGYKVLNPRIPDADRKSDVGSTADAIAPPSADSGFDGGVSFLRTWDRAHGGHRPPRCPVHSFARFRGSDIGAAAWINVLIDQPRKTSGRWGYQPPGRRLPH